MSWLWRGNDSSPASFEKALSKFSSQITAGNLALETTRRQGRKTKAIWTLYTMLAYTLSLAILVLVIGPHNWSTPHYAGVTGTPILIFGVRRVIASLFDWRAGRQQGHLNALQKQREDKIAALKKATKYDSTQELLQKYSGAPPKPETSKESPPNKTKQNNPPQQRTGMPAPPTANIQRRPEPQSPVTPRQPPSGSPIQQGTSPTSPIIPEEPGFAPNAFTADPVYSTTSTSQHTSHGGNWYDRLLDVLIGEDESSARNRLVLLCQTCRLVNGQAPPGVKTAEELGRWRCMGCGAWNGRESEATKLVNSMAKENPETMTATTGMGTGDRWEKVSKGEEIGEERQDIPVSEDRNGATGSDMPTKSEITKRVTRSKGPASDEGL